jgi:FkbM family methyltransferase
MTPWASFYLALHHDRLTVAEAAATDSAWADGVLAERPETQLHRFPRRNSGTFGLDRLGGIPALDQALAELGVKHLNYLRIADAEAAIPVLLGARRLLSHARIDIIEIAGSPTADRPMAAVIALLEPFDFLLLSPDVKLNDLLLTPFDAESRSVVLFALHRRFAGAIMGGNREPNIGALMTAHGLEPRGIIHVGAHAGEEVASYLALGFQRILLIEADPTLAAALVERFRDEPRIAVEACAITDFDGTIDLHLTSVTVANSILSIKRHAAIFPDIHETGLIPVRARTLDSLLAEREQAGDFFNIMTIDIQGAELLALGGAAQLLTRLDGLLVEINFTELYQGCAQIDESDDHLFERGYARVMTMSPYQSCFGDAFYLKAPVAP